MTFFEFDYTRLLIIAIITIISFKWIRSLGNTRIKTWYFLLGLFIFIYSGIGGAIKEVPNDYTVYYCVYVVVLGLFLCHFNRKNKHIVDASRNWILTAYIDKFGKSIILLYFVLLLFDLIYPVFKLQLLVSPPSPSLEGLHYTTFVEGNNMDFISAIIYNAKNIVQPFFYLSLYKYRKNIFRVLVLLLIPVYIDLCSRGIVGRGQMLLPLLICFFSLYEILSPRKKLLIISCATLIPLLSYLLVQFSYMRIGATNQVLSIGDCMQLLLGQEIAYPLQFSSYIKASGNYIGDYIMWILLLPFPGFMKFGYGDPQINLHFTQLVSGLDPTDATFSICLPGLVGESIFIFGDILFPIHAIIMAFIISKLANYLCECNAYRYLFMYVMLVFSYYINRGGTASSYSFAFKQFLILIIFIFFLCKNYRHKKVDSSWGRKEVNI